MINIFSILLALGINIADSVNKYYSGLENENKYYINLKDDYLSSFEKIVDNLNLKVVFHDNVNIFMLGKYDYINGKIDIYKFTSPERCEENVKDLRTLYNIYETFYHECLHSIHFSSEDMRKINHIFKKMGIRYVYSSIDKDVMEIHPINSTFEQKQLVSRILPFNNNMYIFMCDPSILNKFDRALEEIEKNKLMEKFLSLFDMKFVAISEIHCHIATSPFICDTSVLKTVINEYAFSSFIDKYNIENLIETIGALYIEAFNRFDINDARLHIYVAEKIANNAFNIDVLVNEYNKYRKEDVYSAIKQVMDKKVEDFKKFIAQAGI